MKAQLMQRLIEKESCLLLDADNVDNFIQAADFSVLFFANDPVLYPESNDVAVVLPELLKVFKGKVMAGLIDRRIERELQLRYRFTRWPTLVFLKKGEYLGALSGILDWNDYVHQTAEIIAAQPGQPPAFDLDQVCGVSKTV